MTTPVICSTSLSKAWGSTQTMLWGWDCMRVRESATMSRNFSGHTSAVKMHKCVCQHLGSIYSTQRPCHRKATRQTRKKTLSGWPAGLFSIGAGGLLGLLSWACSWQKYQKVCSLECSYKSRTWYQNVQTTTSGFLFVLFAV